MISESNCLRNIDRFRLRGNEEKRTSSFAPQIFGGFSSEFKRCRVSIFVLVCEISGQLPADVRGEKWMKKISVEKREDRK